MTANAAEGIRLMAFAGEGVFSHVLDSQVIMPLRFIGQEDAHVRRALLILTGMRHRKNPTISQRQEAIRTALPGASVSFKYRLPSPTPFQRHLWAGKLRETLAACGYAGNAPIVVHCRGQATAAAAVALKRRDARLRVLVDMRGAQTDEVHGRGLLNWYRRRASEATYRIALAGADALNTVSHKLAEHLQEAGYLREGVPRTVVGCCADTVRFHFDVPTRAARRRELGFERKFVVCYCGGMSHWQRPDAVAQAFTAIARAMPDAHMFVVSREARPLLEHLERARIGEGRVTVRAASHDQVAPFLMAADLGLLLRENTLTNRVASPVKFAEYLRCGLPVILTHYVGDLSELVDAEGVGQTVDFPVAADEVSAAAHAIRQRLDREGDTYRAACSELAAQRFSWRAQAGELIRLYRSLSR